MAANHIEDQVVAEQNRRRKWRRRVIYAAALLALLLVGRWYWSKTTYDRFIAKAATIRLGHTESEVQAVMAGEGGVSEIGSLDNVTAKSGHNVKSKILYFAPAKSQIELFLWRSAVRIMKRSLEDPRHRPVEVRLDDEGLVYWIRRGAEVQQDDQSDLRRKASDPDAPAQKPN
jgi:hypothetical protein